MNSVVPFVGPRDKIEELEETIVQYKELLASTAYDFKRLKLWNITVQEAKFLLCLCGSPTRVRTETQLMAAIWGLENEMRTGAHLRMIKHKLTKKIGDKVKVTAKRGIGYEIDLAGVNWFMEVLAQISDNQKNVYQLKLAQKQSMGQKRPLEHFVYKLPGVLPFQLPVQYILAFEQMYFDWVSIKDLGYWTGMKGNVIIHHLYRYVPRKYILTCGSTRNRMARINPVYHEEIKGILREWLARLGEAYDLEDNK